MEHHAVRVAGRSTSIRQITRGVIRVRAKAVALAVHITAALALRSLEVPTPGERGWIDRDGIELGRPAIGICQPSEPAGA